MRATVYGGPGDYETNLDGVPDAYSAMLGRRATKSLVRVGA